MVSGLNCESGVQAPCWLGTRPVTIAMCYVCAEGVVLGADSTATSRSMNGYHYLNNNQKLFQFGEASTLGVVTWGSAGVGLESHRTLFAMAHDNMQTNNVNSVSEAATALIDVVWPRYLSSDLVVRCRYLDAKADKTDDEYKELQAIVPMGVLGYCLAGYVLPDRTPSAAEILFQPLIDKPSPANLSHGPSSWGVPGLMRRLWNGCADEVFFEILSSGNWSGTPDDLLSIIQKHELRPGFLPIRDAIDFVYHSMYTTIKAIKFSAIPQVCGGPIEVAVITTDRKFRWVKHKNWDAAITEGS